MVVAGGRQDSGAARSPGTAAVAAAAEGEGQADDTVRTRWAAMAPEQDSPQEPRTAGSWAGSLWAPGRRAEVLALRSLGTAEGLEDRTGRVAQELAGSDPGQQEDKSPAVAARVVGLRRAAAEGAELPAGRYWHRAGRERAAGIQPAVQLKRKGSWLRYHDLIGNLSVLIFTGIVVGRLTGVVRRRGSRSRTRPS